MIEVSFIFGTYNRWRMLYDCVQSIIKSADAAKVSYEIVIADGGSTDGTRAYLSHKNKPFGATDIVVVEGGTDGAVKAFNKAYAASRGDYIVTLNDDCILSIDATRLGVSWLDTHKEIGQIAFGYTRGSSGRVIIEEIGMAHPYANFGMIRREVADGAARLCGGFWAPCYRTYGADTELSCWVWRQGYEVQPITKPLVHDLQAEDMLRTNNHKQGRAEADGKLFWSRWGYNKSSPLPKLQPFGEYPNITDEELERLRAHEAKATRA